MELLLILGSIPSLLGVGYVAHAHGLLTPRRRDRLNAVAYYVALPALLFTSTAGRAFSDIVSADLVIGVVIVMTVMVGIAWFLHREYRDPRVRSVGTIQSYHTNFGYLGVPLVALIFGEVATGRAALILGIGALIQISATITILSTLNGAGSIRADLRRILFNPIMLSLFAGLGASAFGIPLHAGTVTVLGVAGDFALPIALLCAGASLTIQPSAIDYRLTGGVLSLKIVVMPLIAFGTFLWLGADTETVRAAVLMFAMPTAVSTYVFSSELGGDPELASMNVFTTTVVSTVTLFGVAQLLFLLT